MKDAMDTPCSEWVEKLSAGHPDDLSSLERTELDKHVASCAACAVVHNEYQAMRMFMHDLRAFDSPPELPSEVAHLWEMQGSSLDHQIAVADSPNIHALSAHLSPSPHDGDLNSIGSFEAFYPLLFSFVRTAVPSNTGPRDSEDVAQEAFIKLFKILESQSITNPKAYIKRIVYAVMADMLWTYKPNLYLSSPANEEEKIQESNLADTADAKLDGFSINVKQMELMKKLSTCLVDTVSGLHSRQKHTVLCTLNDQVDDLCQFVVALKEKNIEDGSLWLQKKEGTDWQALQFFFFSWLQKKGGTDWQALQFPSSSTKRHVAQHRNINLSKPPHLQGCLNKDSNADNTPENNRIQSRTVSEAPGCEHPAQQDGDPYIGRIFGSYRIQSRIAYGSFGYVYLAQHDWLPRTAAVKILKPEYLQSQRERQRFQREALYLYDLRHPNILEIFDFAEDRGLLYMVTEYASKGSLYDRLTARPSRRLSLRSALSILTQVGEALHYVNQHHILHRDLKPGNILFTDTNEARLADFGIAIVQDRHLFDPGTAIRGTPEYMAPEQFMGRNEQKSDQYSLGCMAYQLLTGHLPFIAPNSVALGLKHIQEEPIPLRGLNPHVPAHIEHAVLKAMSKNCEDRFETVKDFVRALQ